MSDISDKDLDHIFRQAAEKYDPAFNEAHWWAMERKLDLPAGGGGLGYYYVVGIILLLLVAGVSSLWIYPFEKGQRITKNEGMSRMTVPMYNELTTETICNTGEVKLCDEKGSGTIGFHQESLSQRNVGQAGGPIVPSQAGQYAQEPFKNHPHLADTAMIRKHEKVRGTLRSSKVPRGTEVDFLRGKKYVLDELGLHYSLPQSVVEEEQALDPIGGLALKLMIAPDFSSSGYYEPDRSGINAGLNILFPLSQRLVAGIGALYSKKIYFHKGETGPYGYTAFDVVDADCRVLDIPVNISYYLSSGPRHHFFISGGVSSYFMLSEDYQFTRQIYTGTEQWDQTYHNKNHHLFSMLNASLGYEIQLSKRSALQVEPFLKAPLRNVGEGGIKLVSTGAFINLVYYLNQN